jgi:glycine dehydrogenase subunit 1
VFFKEFVVDFNATGKTVEAINKALRSEGIFGGLDLSARFPELGECALYCVTEVHSQDDLHRLADALSRILA